MKNGYKEAVVKTIEYVKENWLKVSTKKMAETMFPDEVLDAAEQLVRTVANELGFDVGAKRNIGQLQLKEKPREYTTANRKAIQNLWVISLLS